MIGFVQKHRWHPGASNLSRQVIRPKPDERINKNERTEKYDQWDRKLKNKTDDQMRINIKFHYYFALISYRFKVAATNGLKSLEGE